MEDTGRVWAPAPPGSWTVTVVNPDSESSRAGAPGASSSEFAAKPDAELVSACLSGHRSAFDEIVARHQRVVYRVCYRFTGNHEDASDLAQDVFVRAYKSLGGFRGGASLSTWLYRIAVNAALNHVSARRPAADELDPVRHVDASAVAPDELVARSERSARVRRAIARLPDRQRATVILRLYHDLTHEEIARLFGSSVGTVKANFFHALRNLRAWLGPAERQP